MRKEEARIFQEIILAKKPFSKISGVLRKEWFSELGALIYEILYDLAIARCEISVDSVASEISVRSRKEAVAEFIDAMDEPLFDMISFDHAVSVILRRHVADVMRGSAETTAVRIESGLDQPYDGVLKHVSTVFDVITKDTFISARNTDVCDASELDVGPYNTENLVKLPFNELNYRVGGLRRGQISLIVGATGSGKSCLAAGFALHAVENGKRIVYFDMELGKDSFARRLCSSVTGIPSKAWFSAEELSKYKENVAKWREYCQKVLGKNFVYSGGTKTAEEIALVVQRIAASGKVDMVVIDTFNAVPLSDGNMLSHEIRLIQAIQKIAQIFDVCALVVTQPSKSEAGDSYSQKRPDDQDKKKKGIGVYGVRGSAAIVEAAKVIFGIERYPEENYTTNDGEVNLGKISVLKCSDGETGSVDAMFVKDKFKWIVDDRYGD